MSKHVLATEMSFRGGRATFFAKYREGSCYPLGFEKKHVVDGEVVGGGGGPAFFQDHLWGTNLAEYAAGMVRSPHFMDTEGYVLDPSCLPPECLAVWPTLNRRGKQLLCLDLIGGTDPKEAIAKIPEDAALPKSPPHEAPPESLACPAGCGVTVEGEKDPGKARAAILMHVRLVHPDWQN